MRLLLNVVKVLERVVKRRNGVVDVDITLATNVVLGSVAVIVAADVAFVGGSLKQNSAPEPAKGAT
jgi:hypothetical protein